MPSISTENIQTVVAKMMRDQDIIRVQLIKFQLILDENILSG